MLRRDMFRGFAAVATLLGVGQAKAATEPERHKVVYHLTDADRVGFVLGNIKNHYEGAGGNVEIALVVHGPALAAFKSRSASSAVSGRFSSLVRDGLTPHACANTMHGMDMTLGDLLPGFLSAEAGGVVKLAQLQSQGYAYLRP